MKKQNTTKDRKSRIFPLLIAGTLMTSCIINEPGMETGIGGADIGGAIIGGMPAPSMGPPAIWVTAVNGRDGIGGPGIGERRISAGPSCIEAPRPTPWRANPPVRSSSSPSCRSTRSR